MAYIGPVGYPSFSPLGKHPLRNYDFTPGDRGYKNPPTHLRKRQIILRGIIHYAQLIPKPNITSSKKTRPFLLVSIFILSLLWNPILTWLLEVHSLDHNPRWPILLVSHGVDCRSAALAIA